MAKRFTDTEKWKDPWFQDLPVKYKTLWFYILDNCDVAGVMKINMRLASFQIGEPFEQSEVERIFGDRLQKIDNGKWFISKFIDFQYGELSHDCRPHKSVFKALESHGIKGYSKGIDTLKDKDKDKDKDNKGGVGGKFRKPTVEEISQYIASRNSDVDPNAFYDFYESKGWMVGKNKMKDWMSAVRTWEKRHTGETTAKDSKLKQALAHMGDS